MTAPDTAVSAQAHEAISLRAAEYFQQRRFGKWSAADQAELDAWLAESASHRVAFLRLEWSVARAGQLAALRPGETERGVWSRYRGFASRRLVVPLLIAASFALLAVYGVPLVTSWLQPPDRVFSTDVGGHTLVNFADGTQMALNTNTRLRVRMTNSERTVWLERGEAYFHVTHNAAHPFSVIVGNHRISDLGTEFSVRRSSDGVEVALVSGRAAISNDGAQSATLTPGDDAIATAASLSVSRKSQQQLADELSWRRGALVFRNTPLSEVVREFNRYNSVKLVIVDPSIAGLKVYAEIKTDHYDDLLQLAQTVLNLRVDRTGNRILISRGPHEDEKKVAHARRGE